MTPQLVAVEKELEEAAARAQVLLSGLSKASWEARAPRGGWSVGQCLVHLNLSSQIFLPLLREAISGALQQGPRASGPFRRDFAGWLLCRLLEPPYRIRVKTQGPFEPVQVGSSEAVLAEFTSLQQQVIQEVHRADGLALNRIHVTSPFNARLKYNLYSAFTMIPAHQRRHLWQAEQILRLSLS